jgi:hypothetical protein
MLCSFVYFNKRFAKGRNEFSGLSFTHLDAFGQLGPDPRQYFFSLDFFDFFLVSILFLASEIFDLRQALGDPGGRCGFFF